MNERNCDKDLPLMANASELLVAHYMLNLFCDFNTKTFCGNAILHFVPAKNHSCNKCKKDQLVHPAPNSDEDLLSHSSNLHCNKYFLCILDCCDIYVEGVAELDITPEIFQRNKFCANKDLFPKRCNLKYVVDQWSLKIWNPEVFCPCAFPPFIQINYRTKPEGQSLMWVKDQDGRQAVFTYGAWVNNRSLFPCQEPPTAMASWEASVSVAFPAVVLMSGDCNPVRHHVDGISTFYYHTKMSLPLSTLALAVGFWEIESNFECKPNHCDTDIRICASPSLLTPVTKEFSTYIYSCIQAATEVFGPYPFSRIDFLVVPRGFCSLGMASPNIIFLSQSLISGDGSMLSRVAHEISHSWFGLLIGALDWHEEWLSEGFATFAEDIIHAKALKMSEEKMEDFIQMKTYTRSKILLAEVDNTTEEELLVLRPNNGEPLIQEIENVEAIVLKNGRNEEKCFMQVHYIKGFFLLKFLSSLVGLPSFLQFLRAYIDKFRGKLVSSQEMLEFFISTFPEVSKNGITVEYIIAEWLQTSKTPTIITSCEFPRMNSLFKTAQKEAMKWRKLNAKCSLLVDVRKKRKLCSAQFVQLSPDIQFILLDLLLEEEKLCTQVLKLLNEVYRLEERNAEIRHKWCELIVKHRYHAGYGCLGKFLKDDLAMGVYLYGEMILNGTKSQKQFAEECFQSVRTEMEPNCIVTVQHMLELYDNG